LTGTHWLLVYTDGRKRNTAMKSTEALRLFHTCLATPMPLPCRAPAILRQCRFLREVRMVAGTIRTASPAVYRFVMLLITTFVELRVVAGRSRTRAGPLHVVFEWLMLIHTCHAMPMPRCAVALRSRFQKGVVVAWHVCGMACVIQTRPHFVNQMGKTQS
jgi:hypothetical protein